VKLGVAGYADLMDRIFTSWQEIALTENHVRQLHRGLLVHSDKDRWHRGEYKTSSNSVAALNPKKDYAPFVATYYWGLEVPPNHN
jgi:hypothetical protein